MKYIDNTASIKYQYNVCDKTICKTRRSTARCKRRSILKIDLCVSKVCACRGDCIEYYANVTNFSDQKVCACLEIQDSNCFCGCYENKIYVELDPKECKTICFSRKIKCFCRCNNKVETIDNYVTATFCGDKKAYSNSVITFIC